MQQYIGKAAIASFNTYCSDLRSGGANDSLTLHTVDFCLSYAKFDIYQMEFICAVSHRHNEVGAAVHSNLAGPERIAVDRSHSAGADFCQQAAVGDGHTRRYVQADRRFAGGKMPGP
jgi:hypothetical protein